MATRYGRRRPLSYWILMTLAGIVLVWGAYHFIEGWNGPLKDNVRIAEAKLPPVIQPGPNTPVVDSENTVNQAGWPVRNVPNGMQALTWTRLAEGKLGQPLGPCDAQNCWEQWFVFGGIGFDIGEPNERYRTQLKNMGDDARSAAGVQKASPPQVIAAPVRKWLANAAATMPDVSYVFGNVISEPRCAVERGQNREVCYQYMDKVALTFPSIDGPETATLVPLGQLKAELIQLQNKPPDQRTEIAWYDNSAYMRYVYESLIYLVVAFALLLWALRQIARPERFAIRQ